VSAPAGDLDDQAVERAVACFVAGDQEALRLVYEQCAPAVKRCVRRVVADEHEAQDLTQLVFLKLLWTLDRYDARQGRFITWLLCVARNAAIDHRRRRTPVPSVFSPAWAGVSDEGSLQRREALRESLDALSAGQRQVLLLRQVVGLRPGEIAEVTGRTEASVHGLLHRAHAAMRDALSARDAGPATRGRPRVAIAVAEAA
jgi:RNA polymerase sigma-70 factor (ECF subfamily)